MDFPIDIDQVYSQAISTFSGGKKANFEQRWRRPNYQQEEFLNELAVGGVLKSLGLDISYEEEFMGTTPDWMVKGERPCVVEAVTVNESQFSRSLRLQENFLISRLEAIDTPLNVRLDRDDAQTLLQSESIKEILSGVKRWISNPMKNPFHHGGIKLTALGENACSEHLQITERPLRLPCDRTSSLKRSVINKMHRYGPKVEEASIPFVLGISLGKMKAVPVQVFERIMLGIASEEQFTVAELAEMKLSEKKNILGLMQFYPNLSGTLWLSPQEDYSRVSVVYIENPCATLPAPDQLKKLSLHTEAVTKIRIRI